MEFRLGTLEARQLYREKKANQIYLYILSHMIYELPKANLIISK